MAQVVSMKVAALEILMSTEALVVSADPAASEISVDTVV